MALRKLNPGVPDQHLLQAHADILQPRSQDALTENQAFHDRLAHGFRGLTYTDQASREETPTLQLMSLDPDENTFRAVLEYSPSDRQSKPLGSQHR